MFFFVDFVHFKVQCPLNVEFVFWQMEEGRIYLKKLRCRKNKIALWLPREKLMLLACITIPTFQYIKIIEFMLPHCQILFLSDFLSSKEFRLYNTEMVFKNGSYFLFSMRFKWLLEICYGHVGGKKLNPGFFTDIRS